MSYTFSERSEERMDGVDPRLIEIARLALSISPIDFGIPADGGLRTEAQQYLLFRDGKSKADGYDKKSKHQEGTALDVYAYVDGKASWQLDHLTIVAGAMLEAARRLGYKLTWGGWWPWDKPHFQLAN